MALVLSTQAAIPCAERLHWMWLNIRLEFARGS